jgi:hypothetical protein
MKTNILRISILPLILFTVLTFANIQPPQKDKGKNDKENKEQGQSGNKGKDEERGNGNSKGNAQVQGNNQGRGNNAQGHGNDKGNQGQGNNKSGDHGQGNNKSDNHGKRNSDMDNGHGHGINGKINHGKGNSSIMNGRRDVELDWGLNDFGNRKRPGNQKKVTICHRPGGQGSNPVTINVSENAVQAHLNHGDQLGNCTMNYSDRWSSNYINSRENVYNTYEQTWETMSYSEALLRLAAEKLLGVKTDLTRTRSTLTSQEIQRREALIYELQNNVNTLDNQLGVTRQRLDSDVNIIIKL